MTDSYDVLIIGGGNAGFGVSSVAHKAGRKIAFIEERDFGGTCPNRGCTPKKVLVAAAHAMHEIERAGTHCIEVGKPKLDWSGLIKRADAAKARRAGTTIYPRPLGHLQVTKWNNSALHQARQRRGNVLQRRSRQSGMLQS